jgi:hypothetical protein
MRYSKLTIENAEGVTPTFTHDFQCSATSAGLTTTGGEVTSISTLCPDGSFSETAPRTYQLTVTAVQDVESADSLMLFCMDNEGDNALATFYPKTDGAGVPVGRGWEGTIVIALPDTVGGAEPGNYATFTVVFPYVGKPSPIDAAGAPITFGASSEPAKSESKSKSEPDREPVPA